MADMNLDGKRDAPGVSVFWLVVAGFAAALIVLGLTLNYQTGPDVNGVAETPPSVMPVGDQPRAEEMVAGDGGALPNQTGDTATEPNSQGLQADQATVEINDDPAQN